MPKIAATLFVMYALLTVSFAIPARAQQTSTLDGKVGARDVKKSAQPTADAPEPGSSKRAVDFKRVFDDESKRFKADSEKFDPVKIELEKARQTRKKGWSKNDTAIMVVFAVGIAVLVWLVIKYGKDCAETNPPNCSFATDEFCTCERYEEETGSRGAVR